MKKYDVIIIGGSYAGLSAAMTLGRSLRKVAVIDSGEPCNKQTPRSHNFITQDGTPPLQIARDAKTQVLEYDTVSWINGIATTSKRIGDEFEIELASGETLMSRKLLICSGIKDIMPPISGFSECWGISVLHCPYCHGYEVRNKKIGLIGNGDLGYELVRLIQNWSDQLILFTNGPSILSKEHAKLFSNLNVPIIEDEIQSFTHTNGQLLEVQTSENSIALEALFARVPFEQRCTIPEKLGVELSDAGHLLIDDFNKTSVPGLFAAGDCTTPFRSVAAATSSGNEAGVFINMELIEEDFETRIKR